MAKKKAHFRKRKTATKVQTEVHPNAAGIDLGSEVHYVAVPDDRRPMPVRSFGTFTEDLQALADWLVSCGIDTVAMEATGVYWVPIYDVLEARGIEVYLVNARHVKNVPGRKTDVQDCQWLQYLHSVGLLNGSFRPGAEVVAIRCLHRHRESLSQAACQHILRVQKALDQMNVLVHHAVSDITGATGQAILDAIIGGERDPATLAGLRDRRCKKSEAVIAKALEGEWKEEHLFTLRQSFEAWRYHQQLIAECNKQIEKQMAALEDRTSEPAPTWQKKNNKSADESLRQHLYKKFGVDLTAAEGVDVRVAMTFLTEVGPDVNAFPTVEHFCSWLTLCPDNRITGGRRRGAHTRQSANRLSAALRMAAQSFFRSDSAIGHWYRRIRAKLGAKAAAVAGAHKLARILYAMVKNKTPYDPARHGDPEKQRRRQEKALEKRAAELGFKLVPAARQPA